MPGPSTRNLAALPAPPDLESIWLERRHDRWTPAAEGTIPTALAKHRRTVRVLDEALRKYAKDRC